MTEMAVAIVMPQPWRGGMLNVALHHCIALARIGVKPTLAIPSNLRLDIVRRKMETCNIDIDLEILPFNFADAGAVEGEPAWHQALHVLLQSSSTFSPVTIEIEGIRAEDRFDRVVHIGTHFNRIISPAILDLMYIPDVIQRYVPLLYPPLDDPDYPYFFMNTFNIQYSSALLTTTDQTKDDVITYHGVSSRKVHCIDIIDTDYPNPKSFSHQLFPEFSEPFFLWVTNVSIHKNHLVVLKAFSDFLLHRKNWKLIVVGAGSNFISTATFPSGTYQDAVSQFYASDRSLQASTQILDEVSDSEYRWLVNNCAALIHGNIYDNGSFAIFDASSSGKSIVCADYPQARYICDRAGADAFFFSPHLSYELTAALVRASDRNDTAEQVSGITYSEYKNNSYARRDYSVPYQKRLEPRIALREFYRGWLYGYDQRS